MTVNSETEVGFAKTSPEEWMARAAVFELLAMGLLVPTSMLAETLSSGEYTEACAEAMEGCGLAASTAFDGLAEYAGANPNDLLHELRREYTYFFSKVPEPAIIPYIGVWHEHQRGCKALLLVSRQSIEIERFMRRCGVAKDLSSGQSNDPVDHIGTICEFMKYLCLVNARAVRVADTAEVREEDFECFFERYFKGYALWCSNRIGEFEHSAYYGFVAEALALLAKGI